MNNLQFWENQRLIKELQFVESDFLYLEELIKNAHPLFLRAVDEMVNNIPELKSVLNKEIPNPERDNNVEMGDENLQKSDEATLERISEDLTIKGLYRQIVKKTHPDKAQNLESFYIEATKAYESNDIPTMIKISWDLNIPFEWTDDIRDQIISRIEDFKVKKGFLENNFTFKWLKADDDKKSLILVEYLKNKIMV